VSVAAGWSAGEEEKKNNMKKPATANKRSAEIKIVVPDTTMILGWKRGYVTVQDETGDYHTFVNGSINQVAERDRWVGNKGWVVWQTGAQFGLWFFGSTMLKKEPNIVRFHENKKS